jgi:hypothetical protein
MQSKRAVEEVTLASEIMQLPNREGFMKRATNAAWRRVRFAYITNDIRIRAFEPADESKP